MATEYDAYYYQVKRVEAALAAGAKEAAFPSPGHAESRAVMQCLTDWEALCRT